MLLNADSSRLGLSSISSNRKVLLAVGVIFLLSFLVLAGYLLFQRRVENLENKGKILFSSDVTRKTSSGFPLQGDVVPPKEQVPPSFGCVVDELVNKKIELAKGFYAIFSVHCKYFDQNQREQRVLIPLAVTDGHQMVVAGYGLREYEPRLEKVAGEAYWLRMLGQIGFTGLGFILHPNIERPDPSLGTYGTFQGFGVEIMRDTYTQKQLEEFAATGDPSKIMGILWTTNVGINNHVLNDIDETELSNITPAP